MYRFDDKRRRRLLEDALVADLLDGASVAGTATPAGETSGNAAVTTAAAARASIQSHKSKA